MAEGLFALLLPVRCLLLRYVALRTAIIITAIAVKRRERLRFTGWTQPGGSWGVFFVT